MTQQRPKIGYIKLIQGRWSEDARDLAVADVPPARGRAGGTLYILVELSGDLQGREELAERLVTEARRAYLASAGSFTLGLRRAIEAANASLFQANLQTMRDERRYGGISCVVVSGSDAYVGQAGPAVVYALHAEEFHRFPSESPWLPAPGEPPAPPEAVDGTTWVPLGIRRSLEVNLFHCSVEPGDVLCLASSHLAQWIQHEDLELILDQELEDSLQDLLSVAEGQDLTALIVQMPPLAGAEEPTREVQVWAERAGVPGPGWPARIAQGVTRMDLGGRLRSAGATLTHLLARFLPDREAQPLPPVAEEQKQRLLAGVALFIPLVIALFTLIYYLQQASRFDALVGQARQEIAQAQGADKATAESLLRDAALQLENALEIRPQDGEAQRLKGEIETELEKVQGLTRLADLQPILEFSPSSQLRRVWAQQGSLYVLDLGQQQVLRIPPPEQTDEKPQVVLMQGQVFAGHTVVELVDMAWMSPRGGADGRLVVLARDGVLWMLEPEGAAGQALPEAEAWGRPVALSTFEGNVYVLDAGRDQIWKYVPSATGYTSPAVAWLESPTSLRATVDMAIDGAIYVLDAEGDIRKFAAGRRVGFAVQGLDRPFKDPAALFTTPQLTALYVVDPGNRRIVELDKSGAFRRQWLAPLASTALDEPSGLFVDQAGRRIYVLSGQRLYVATLP